MVTDGFGAGVRAPGLRGFVVGADEAAELPGAAGQMLASAADTGGLFSLVRSSAAAGSSVARHVHSGTDECFFVLAGEYDITCGDQRFSASAGSFVYLPRGLPHSYTVGDADASKLILSVPGGIEHYFADFGAGVDAEELMHRHGVTFLDAADAASN